MKLAVIIHGHVLWSLKSASGSLGHTITIEPIDLVSTEGCENEKSGQSFFSQNPLQMIFYFTTVKKYFE